MLLNCLLPLMDGKMPHEDVNHASWGGNITTHKVLAFGTGAANIHRPLLPYGGTQ